jgi:hypothetical protein
MALLDLAFKAVDPPRRAVVPRTLRRPSAAVRTLPGYLIVGAQKSGTTSLQHYLDSEPGVRAPLVKEVHFFDHHARRGTGWYRSNFPLAGRDRHWLAGEASPYYLLHPHAPARAAAVVPDVRIVAVLRNPVTRAYSYFQHARALGFEPIADFAEALAREGERTDDAWQQLVRTGRRQLAVERYSYLRRGRYAPQLRRWLEAFRAEQILVVTSDELFRDSRRTLPLVYRHIGLSAAPARAFERRHARAYPPMSSAVRAWLTDYFADDVADVEALLPRRTNWLDHQPSSPATAATP